MLVSRILLIVAGLVASIAPASAQSRARIFDVELGTHVSALPSDEWVDPACGTNGGPPSLPLESFAEFSSCRVEERTGLHEVWFIYDDEWEYIARAYRDPAEIRSYSANVFFQQPIITSLLVDQDGLVQGYRVVTDPRAPVPVRLEAYTLHGIFKGLFSGAPWECTNLPAGERERPVRGRFLKENCSMATDDRIVILEGRLLRKPGQVLRDVAGMSDSAEGDFESTARLEVFAREAVEGAPCCQAAAEP